MSLYIRALDASERVAIERGRRSESGAWSRRCQILRASSAGARVREIAHGIGWHPESVRRTIRRFNAGGLDALRPKKRPGRAPWESRLSPDRLDALLDQARSCPQQHGIDLPVWTADALAQTAVDEGILEERVSAKCIRNLFRRQGYS